jgi:parallel beta-helix repeat protein
MNILRLGIRLLAVASFGLLTQSLRGQTTAPATQPIYIAADVVVDPGGNDANPGTRRLPVKTIGKGISLAGAGGIILVNPGNYYEAIKPADGQIIYGYGGCVDGQSRLATLAAGGVNVTLKGLKFVNANSGSLDGAVTAGSGWRLEDVEADGNSQAGIDVHGSANALARGVTLLRCKAIGNGREGIKGGYAADVVVQDCLSQGNNPTNANSAGNEAGGGKWSQCNGVTFLNYTVKDNHGYGLWLDFNNQNIAVKGGSFTGQTWAAPGVYYGTGIMIEISQGPVSIDGATFSGNSGGGIQIGESSNITISNNSFATGEYVDMRDLNNRTPYHVSNITFTGNCFTHSFLSTNGSAGQYPWDDSQFHGKHIVGSGNVFTAAPVAYLGSGATRQVNTTAEFTKRTAIGAATTQPATR